MREQQWTGCVLGLAIGDALGFPAEFRRLVDIRRDLGPQGITDFMSPQDDLWRSGPVIIGRKYPPGTYTDDTQMSIAIAQALLRAGRDDLESLMQAMGEEFVRWYDDPQNDRAPGETCCTGCQRLKEGVHWQSAGVAQSKGCGSAMRSAPIGLYYFDQPERLAEVSRASSLPTHGHDAALEGAFATAFLVSLALQGAQPAQMYEALMRETHGRSEDFTACLAKLPAMLQQPPEIALSTQGLGESWVAEEAVASALYCFWRSPQDFAKVVLTAANTDGDSDSIACIAGAICGAANGIEAIPPHWIRDVEDSQQLLLLGQQLHHAALSHG